MNDWSVDEKRRHNIFRLCYRDGKDFCLLFKTCLWWPLTVLGVKRRRIDGDPLQYQRRLEMAFWECVHVAHIWASQEFLLWYYLVATLMFWDLSTLSLISRINILENTSFLWEMFGFSVEVSSILIRCSQVQWDSFECHRTSRVQLTIGQGKLWV